MGMLGLYILNSSLPPVLIFRVTAAATTPCDMGANWLNTTPSIPRTAGAGHITTVEFRPTISHIPNHQVVQPLDWAQGLQNGTVPSTVDFAFSFSSWEHDGLGRYGDPVDPWGDVKAMQRASCYVKPGKPCIAACGRGVVPKQEMR